MEPQRSQPPTFLEGATGAGARVAVIDGGIHSTHIDIAPNLDVARSRSFVLKPNPNPTQEVQPFNFDQRRNAQGAGVLPSSQFCSKPRVGGGPLVSAPCFAFDFVFAPVRGGPASIGTYSWAAGTSMAAPAVSGVAALIIGRVGRIGPAQVEARLRASADDLGKPGKDDFYGNGRVNALRAVQ